MPVYLLMHGKPIKMSPRSIGHEDHLSLPTDPTGPTYTAGGPDLPTKHTNPSSLASLDPPPHICFFFHFYIILHILLKVLSPGFVFLGYVIDKSW